MLAHNTYYKNMIKKSKRENTSYNSFSTRLSFIPSIPQLTSLSRVRSERMTLQKPIAIGAAAARLWCFCDCWPDVPDSLFDPVAVVSTSYFLPLANGSGIT